MAETLDRLPENNNFDLLRFIAAAMVIFYHSFAIAGQFSQEPFLGWLGMSYKFYKTDNLGALWVHVFFVISGYLVTASYQRKSQGYIVRRMKRILPGLIVCIAFCCFIVGSFFSPFPLTTYFTSKEFYQYLAFVFVFPIKNFFSIPGVFDHNPPHMIPGLNVSLWTIPWEMVCYILLPLLCDIRKYTKDHRIFVLLGALFIYWRLDEVSFAGGVVNCLYFFIGSALYQYRDHLHRIYNPCLCIGAMCYLVFGYATNLYDFVDLLVIPYLTIYFACHAEIWPDFATKVKGDYSYGLYIYSWPVQQALVSISDNTLSPTLLFMLSFSLTLLLAMASWHCVEKYWLRKSRV